MTRVAVIGNHAHPFCSEVHWARAFAENRCDVFAMQVDEVVRDPAAAMEVLRTRDLVTYTRTHAPGRYLDHTWTARWRELEHAGVKTVGIHLDRYWDLEREHLVTAEPKDAQFTMGLVATADGGNDGRWQAAGVNHAWFRPGVDRQEASSPGAMRAEYHHEIVFTGSAGQYHHEYAQRGLLLQFLRDRYAHRFVQFGHGGDYPVVRQQLLNDLYASSRIVIGDSCFANSPGWRTDARKYVSDRLYESIGRGAFVIFPRLPNMAEDFGITPGVHCATYEPGVWSDLALQIEFYLEHPEERQRIAQAGREHVLANHTYTHRMADLLATVGLTEVSTP